VTGSRVPERLKTPAHAGRALASVVLGTARCLTFPRKRFVHDFTSRVSDSDGKAGDEPL